MKILIILEIILTILTLKACKTSQSHQDINTSLSLSGAELVRGPRMIRTEGAAFTKIITQSDKQAAVQFAADSGDIILGNELIQVKIKGIDAKEASTSWAPLIDSLRLKTRSGWSAPISLQTVFRRNWPKQTANVRRTSLIPSTSEDRAYAYVDLTYEVTVTGQATKQEFLRLVVSSQDSEVIVLTDDKSFIATRPFLKGRTSIGMVTNQDRGIDRIERFPKAEDGVANHLLLSSNNATGCILASTPFTLNEQTSNDDMHIVDTGGRSVGGMEFISFVFDTQVCASANFYARARHQCLSRSFDKSGASTWFADWDLLDQCIKATPYATLFISRPREPFRRSLVVEHASQPINSIVLNSDQQNVAVKLVPEKDITITEKRLGQVWFPQPGLKLGPQQSEQLNLPAGLSENP